MDRPFVPSRCRHLRLELWSNGKRISCRDCSIVNLTRSKIGKFRKYSSKHCDKVACWHCREVEIMLMKGLGDW